MRPRATIGLVPSQGTPIFSVTQIGWRFSRTAALRLHAAAGHQLAQHLTKHGTPLMHGWGSAFGMDGPLRRVAADSLGELFRTLCQKIAEPTFAPRRHIQE